MKAKMLLFGVFLILAAAAAQAQDTWVPVYVQRAELDGTDIFPYGWNQLDVERDEELTLKLELFAWQDAENVEIRATISGYEHGDSTPISARIGPFDFEENVTYVKKLKFTLPDDVDLDDYKLRVEIADRNSWSQTITYDLQIDAPRHAVKIMDVTFNPGNTVKAGQSLLGRVRIENRGQKDQRDVKVTMGIPALDISATQYIEEIDNGDEQEETEEFFLRMPKCAAAGTYDVKVDAWFNDNRNKVSGTGKITVTENEACKEPEPVVVVQQPVQNNSTPAVAAPIKSNLRTALEVVLLVLVALLVIVGLVLGFTRMKEE
ncbi:hypothetical protein HY489_01470 [Candidatus Woesearchaeota archaeon]|nr:hypothetical protein [Candidatus Woesearchaeota archaeon]